MSSPSDSDNASPPGALRRLTKPEQDKPLTETDRYLAIKRQISNRLLNELPPELDTQELRQHASEIIRSVLADPQFGVPVDEQEQQAKQVIDEVLGYGPLEALLTDDSITEIIIASPDRVYVKRYAQLEQTTVVFENAAHVLRILDKLVSPTNPDPILLRDTLPPAVSVAYSHGTVTIITPPSTTAHVVIINIVRN